MIVANRQEVWRDHRNADDHSNEQTTPYRRIAQAPTPEQIGHERREQQHGAEFGQHHQPAAGTEHRPVDPPQARQCPVQQHDCEQRERDLYGVVIEVRRTGVQVLDVRQQDGGERRATGTNQRPSKDIEQQQGRNRARCPQDKGRADGRAKEPVRGEEYPSAAFGIVGAVFLALDFPAAPVVLGFVLGPLLEENFRRAMLLSRGSLSVFVTRPISAWIIAACALLIVAQVYAYLKRVRASRPLEAEELLVE